MYKVYTNGLICMILLSVTSTLNSTQQNDWIPISKDEVLSEFSRLNRRYVDNTYHNRLATNRARAVFQEDLAVTTTQPASTYTDTKSVLIKNAMKLVHPVKMINHGFYPVAPETITSVNDLQSAMEENSEKDPEHNVITKPIETFKEKSYDADEKAMGNIGNFRKPKALTDSHVSNKIGDDDEFPVVKKLEMEIEKANIEIEQDITQENRKFYQVTEETMDALQEEQSNTEERTGYFYTSPVRHDTNAVRNNLTNNFIDILSKHNIRPDDNLPNYSLSRTRKNRNPLNGFMLIPIPLGAFPQFNNLNLDPLAILLSNYGYYLPGSYGIRGKYRNLYSYLASNNIHNNEPFGSYKIFSDTDSSN